MQQQGSLSEQNAVRLPSIGGQIAAIIEERILKNVYPIGFKLPPERQLAEDFHVSRQSVRAALRILATRGMIQSRQGVGIMFLKKLKKTFNLAGKKYWANTGAWIRMFWISAAVWKV